MTTTFTNGNDVYIVSSAGTYDLEFLGGEDTLTVNGGTSTTARMGDGNDLARLIAGLATVYGDAGADRFEIWASNATVNGGADGDTINVRGGTGLTANGGLGTDHFNFYADTTGITIYGDDGNDVFTGYNRTIGGTLSGGANNDFFVLFRSGVTLAGGIGSDIYRITVGSPATLAENVAEGLDSVQVSRGFSYTLPANIEKLVVGSYFGSTTGSATLTGNALANTIVGWSNNETLKGGGGDDVLNGKGGNDTVFGGLGNDVLIGGTGTDVLFGEAGNDTLKGLAGDDLMTGGTGNDIYYVDSLADTVTESGGEGTDTTRVSVSGYTLADNVENGTIQNIGVGLGLYGNALDNVLTGNLWNDSLNGGDGNDTLRGGAGADGLSGDNGNDVLVGGDGNDGFNGGAGEDVLIGGAGNDLFIDEIGGDTMSGGPGDDFYIIGRENFPQFFTGSELIENSGEGTDTVRSWLYDFTLPDNFENGQIARSGTLHGNGSDNGLFAVGEGDVVLEGLGGNDTLFGFADNDTLFGGDGDDALDGDAANDTLYGEDGDDALDGGDGSDWLIGGLGQDLITTGAGGDIVKYEQTFDALFDATGRPNDEITDFDTFYDFIWLQGIDADTNTAGTQSFHFTGGTWDQTVGDVWLEADGLGGTGYYLFAEVNGDEFADMAIHLILPGGIDSFTSANLII